MQFKREKYLGQLIERMHNGQIKVITGIRRCGKSFLLFNIFAEYLKSLGTADDHIITLALDDYLNEQYRDPDVLAKYLHSLIKPDSCSIFYRRKDSSVIFNTAMVKIAQKSIRIIKSVDHLSTPFLLFFKLFRTISGIFRIPRFIG